MVSLADQVDRVFRQLLPPEVRMRVHQEFVARDFDALYEIDAELAMAAGDLEAATRALSKMRRRRMSGWVD